MSEHTPEGEAAAAAVDSQVTAEVATEVALDASQQAAEANQRAADAEQVAEVAIGGAVAASETAAVAGEVATQADEKAEASGDISARLLEQQSKLLDEMAGMRREMYESRQSAATSETPEEVAVSEPASRPAANTSKAGATQAAASEGTEAARAPGHGLRRRRGR